MNVYQRYTEVKEGKCSKQNFLTEALRDPRFTPYISNLNTYDEVISIMKAKSFIVEEVKKTPNKFNFTALIKEAASAGEKLAAERAAVDRMNPYEYDKGWRYELKCLGSTDDESILKAQKKAIANITKDGLHYTKLEMGKWAPEPDLKDIPVKDGKVEYEKRNTLQKVKMEEPKQEDKAYVKDAMDKTAFNKLLEKSTNVKEGLIVSLTPTEDQPCSCHDKDNTLQGGKGDNTTPDEVDPTELQMGIEHEMEHTDDPEKAQEIALDHLTEDPHYYSNLKAAGIDEAVIQEAIRKRVMEKLKEYVSSVPKPQGLLVDKEKLIHLLRNYTWPSTKQVTNYKDQDSYQDEIAYDYKSDIDDTMNRMIQQGEKVMAVSIYNSAAKEAGATERWGDEYKEAKVNNAARTIEDYIEANPKDKNFN